MKILFNGLKIASWFELKVLMLNPPFFPKFSKESRSPAVSKGGCVYFPIWLAYATGVLEQNGFEVKLLDAPAESKTLDETLKIAENFNPKLIVMETSTPSYCNDLIVAEEIKKILPNSFILFVGTHVSALPEESLKEGKAIDAVARHEYDFIARDLAVALRDVKALETVKGLSFRKIENGVEKIAHNVDMPLISSDELDKMPFVSQIYRKHLKIENYFYPSILFPQITLIFGRGCKYRCYFCVWPQTLMGHNYRHISPKKFVDELEWISKNLPQVKEIMVEDDTLTQEKETTIGICNEILSRNLKIIWSCNSRADIDLETMEKMKKAGCRLMCVGFESANQQILNNIKKGTTVEKLRQFMKDSKKAGILIHGCFILGNRGETKETIRQTVQLAKELDPDTAQFFPIMVYPGTEAFDWAKKDGLLTTCNWSEWLLPDGSHNTIISRPELSAKELVNACDSARREFYLRPKYILGRIKMSFTNPEEIPRLFKSGKTFFKYLLRI